jgi:aminoglycoside phosphotransferase (APT) family kinase protein
MIDEEKGLTSEDFKQLQTLTPRFEQICTDLAACGIPASVNHGDFHDGNVLLKNGRITFFDWGDADITHPFVSLRTWFVSMEIALKLDDYAPPTPEMTALLHRYLELWERFASKEELLQAYALSRPVASIVKTLAWHHSISRMDGSLRDEYAWIVPEVLREFMVYEGMLDGENGTD